MSTPRICPNLSTLAPGRACAADTPMKVASAPAWAMSGDSNGPLRGQCGCQWRTPRYLTEADQRTLPKVDHHARDRPGNRGHLRLAGLGGVGSELQVCSKLASNPWGPVAVHKAP